MIDVSEDPHVGRADRATWSRLRTPTSTMAATQGCLGLDNTTLNKIEHRTRNVSLIEVREPAEILRTTVVELDVTAAELEAARSHPVAAARGKATT